MPAAPEPVKRDQREGKLPAAQCPQCRNLNPHCFPASYHVATTSEIFTSADHGCSDCALLKTVLSPYLVQKTGIDLVYISAAENASLALQFRHGPDANRDTETVLEVFTTTDKSVPWPAIHSYPSICGDTGSQEAISKIAAWLENCTHTHALCNFSISAQLPTRVLEISGPESVRLRVTADGENCKYTCLSHCWGTEPFVQTNKETLITHQRGIAWAELPRTFQEAISVTYRLGFRYIWIDSLCIVQDDIEDWQREGSNMDSIYANSSLTIAATHASSPDQGCFTKASPSHISHTTEHWNENHERYLLQTRRPLNQSHWRWWDDDLPLLKRAWVFQERWLSKRMVHFGPHELLWECHEVTTCECGASRYEGRPRLLKDYAYSGRPAAQSDPPSSFPEQWSRVVERYTTKRLTFERDIFPALQGVAKQMQKMHSPSEYCAGLWRNNLTLDLLWMTDSLDSSSRPAAWRAPTWSWASIVSSVTWNANVFDLVKCTRESFEVLTVRTTPMSQDPFGQLLGGTLILRGCCLDTTLVDCHGRYDLASCTIDQDGEEAGIFPIEFFPDYRYSEEGPYFVPHGMRLKIMKMLAGCNEGSDSRNELFALVFRCVDQNKGVYERFGLVQVMGARAGAVMRAFDEKGKDNVITVV